MADAQHLYVENWKICIKIDQDHQDGRIIVHHTGDYDGRPKTHYRTFKLQDGELTLSNYAASGLPKFQFRPRNLKEVLKQNFGITSLARNDPNRTFTGFFELLDDQTKVSFTVITDGKVSYYTKNPGVDFCMQELLDLNYRGEVKAKVEDATWAIICKGPTADNPSQESSFRLNTVCKNPWFLFPQLEKCLSLRGYGRFEDVLEDIEIDPELMELIGK